MPNYVSHAIMAEEYSKTINHELNKYLEIDNEKIKTFSIGQDYTFSNGKLFEKTHNENVQAFFINLITYITKNKLYNDDTVMSYLYGQIAHYALDSTLHPFIYAKELTTKKVGLISKHTTTEYLIDNYLSEEKKGLTPNKINYSHINEKNFNKDLEKLINEVYQKTYHIADTTKAYKKTLLALKALIKASKLKFRDKLILKKFLKYEKFFKENNITKDYILNKNNEYWENPFSKEKETDSFNNLYQKAINKAINLTIEANNYIYGKRNLKKLVLAFPNESYDTGIDCKYEKKLVRK